MGYVHHCLFCELEREGESATVIEPHCERCGCSLVATPADEHRRRQRAPAAAPALLPPSLAAPLLRAARLTLLALMLAGAARIGAAHGGLALAVAAVGLAGLFSLPLAVGD
jgi:hypothetical protein